MEPWRTAEKALIAVIQEAYLQDISMRSVDDLVRTMGLEGASKSPAASAPRLTSGWATPWPAPSRATGPISGWTRPT
ncbi:hypothetical protein [Teichococcus aestuarii]